MANRLGALRADTDVFTTFEGDNHILLQLVAKGLLTDYSSNFGDLDQLGMVRFVANLAVETVVERTSAHKLLERIKDVLPGGSDDSWDQEAGLLDPEYQLAMFRWREEHILSGVARRLKRGIDNGMETVEVFSRVQDHVIAAGRAHVERLVLEAFVEKNAAMVDSDNKVALNILCDLYALSTIEADRALWMEHGRLSSARSKAISREVSSLCRQLRPIAEDLVDAFGIPPEMLHAEMLEESGSRPRVVRAVADAGATPDPRPRRLGRGPALGDVLRLDRRAPPGRRDAVAGGDRQRPAPVVRRGGGDRSPAGRLLGARRAVRWRGGAARAATRPGGAGTSPPTSPGPCWTAPWRSPRRRQVAAQVEPVLADVGDAAVPGRGVRPGRLLHRPALLPRPPPGGARDGPRAAARRGADRERAAQRHRGALRARCARSAGSPGSWVRPRTSPRSSGG